MAFIWSNCRWALCYILNKLNKNKCMVNIINIISFYDGVYLF